MKLETKEDWWTTVEDHWDDLQNILKQFLPTEEYQDVEGNITSKPMFEIISNLKKKQDADIARYLVAAWAAAPDTYQIHKIPGWSVLCDLCSEEWCLYDEF